MAKATEELVGVQMTLLHCAACGLPFMMPTEYEQRRRNDHQSFFCPSGHPNVYNAKSEAERLKEQLANARESAQWERSRADRAAEEAEHARRSRNGMKGQAGEAEEAARGGRHPTLATARLMKLPSWLHPFRRTPAAPRRETYAAMKARGLAELQRRFGDEWTDADTDRYYATFMALRYLGLLVPEARVAELERTLRRVVGG